MNRRVLAAVGLALVALVAWLLWPSRYAGVANLDSSGAAIVAFGDSLTAGHGAADGEDYPSVVSDATGLEIINAGVSGDTTAGALKRLDRHVLARDPRIVIVGLGGNDFLRSQPIADTETNLREIIRRIQESGAMVVLLGFRFPSLRESYEEMYERVADETNALLIEDVLDGILSNPDLRSDAIHPNARGYALMAERIAPELEALIETADSR